MKKKWSILVCTLLCIMSCSNNKEEAAFNLIKKGAIRFPTGMATYERFTGTFLNNQNEEMFYFANTATDKLIKYFDDSGNLAGEIRLDTIFKLEYGIDALEVVAEDSVFVLAQYSSNVYLINSDGEILSQTKLKQQLKTDIDFELYGSTMGKFISGNNIVTGVGWIPRLSRDDFESELDFAIERSKVFLRKPTLYSFSLKDNKEKEVNAFNLFKALPPDTSLFYGVLFNCNITPDKIIYWSWYSDTVLSIDVQSLRLLGKHPIKSKYSSTAVKPLRWEEFLENLDGANERFKTQGHMNSIYFNTALKHYYVVVSHDTSAEEEEELGFRPWSLLIYDDKFKLIGEKPFMENKYKSHLIPYQNGFLLKKEVAKVAYDKITLEFDYYEY